MVAVLTQEPVNVTLLGERVFSDAIKLRVLIREVDLTQGRLREGGGRAPSDAVASPESLEAPAPPQALEEAGGPSIEPAEGSGPAHAWI